MDKVINTLYGIAVGICVLMLSVCMMLLPDNPPPEWVGYAAITAVAVFAGTASVLGLYCSVRSAS